MQKKSTPFVRAAEFVHRPLQGVRASALCFLIGSVDQNGTEAVEGASLLARRMHPWRSPCEGWGRYESPLDRMATYFAATRSSQIPDKIPQNGARIAALSCRRSTISRPRWQWELVGTIRGPVVHGVNQLRPAMFRTLAECDSRRWGAAVPD